METSCRNLVKENQTLLCENSFGDLGCSQKCDDFHILELPDSIFLHIFSYLPFSTIGNIAQVCHRWKQISRDDLLWKSIFLQHYKLPSSTTLPPRANSWKSEFKRLYYHAPCMLSEERKEHRDEVLHVSFSHDGTMFATCSKDGYFKVWRSTYPSKLLFERDMMSLFSWKYTQFSQFNETDTSLLVSGVYFGAFSISGEIAVFDLQGDFRMQCRVNNKPYDVFGAWYDNDHLLSGTLYWTGNFTSVSAVWLSKASQEVESEMESVSMVLYRFENVNSSSIRLLHVAEVETEQGDEDPKGASALPFCSNSDITALDKVDGSHFKPLPGRHCTSNTIPSEMSELFRKNISEDDFDISDEDLTDDNDDDGGNELNSGRNRNCWKRTSEIVNRSDHELNQIQDFFKTHPEMLSPSDCEKADANNSADLPSLNVPFQPVSNVKTNNRITDPSGQGFLHDCAKEHENFYEKESTSLSKSGQEAKNNNDWDSSNNCEYNPSDLSEMFVGGKDGNLSEQVGGGLIDSATQTEETPSRTSSFQSLSHMSHSSSLSNELCKSPREKLLIYTWGSETYVPHKIGIKKMKPSDFCKNARQASVLLPDVMENLQNVSGDRRDVPDISIEMHGHIVGLCLSPDQRYLYVNCRSWPKNCVITDPQESLPLAQEVEIFTIDLTTFQFTGPVLQSHKAYTDSDKCFFLNLDVSDDYVVSGAEDRRGYLWDRHYGIPLYHFDHRDVVNSVAISPRDPEIAVSVSDDHTFKVWMSRRKMKQFEKRGVKVGHLTHRQSPVE